MSEREIKVGDWIKFYQGGLLIIAEVNYIRKSKHTSWVTELCTDKGIVNMEYVLEMRRR